MHQIELLDRGLISMTKTENAFVDINNRIISGVNDRKNRLNDLNSRVQNISQRILKLYNCQEAMRVESSFNYPEISSVKSFDRRPHQSIFYDDQEKVAE